MVSATEDLYSGCYSQGQKGFLTLSSWEACMEWAAFTPSVEGCVEMWLVEVEEEKTVLSEGTF